MGSDTTSYLIGLSFWEINFIIHEVFMFYLSSGAVRNPQVLVEPKFCIGNLLHDSLSSRMALSRLVGQIN